MKRPLVVKLGSSLVVDARGRTRRALLRARAAEIAEFVAAGTPVCVVSSGAIALGLRRLDVARRPTSLPRLQAASALGQAALQRSWQDALAPHGLEAAQILLTSAEIADRRTYINVRNALAALFALGAVPVVNENDATSTDEITFGDNDALAAQVAVLVRARLLVLLTSVPGVLHDGVLIENGACARLAVLGPSDPLGRGGMESKVAAAELAAGAGIPTVIADGAAEGALERAAAGSAAGTRFAAAEGASAFKLWLRHGKRVSARVHVDEGARRAIVAGGASLLAVGVTGREGEFRAGDGIDLVGPDGTVFARGIASVDAADLDGRPAGVEAVHRGRLVLLA
ncbi:MAG TPA: glutamate 5-kinase [Gaiellaceae bacterium]|nr:glutamate 5-kinase [Gaiellaceae bacterium]